MKEEKLWFDVERRYKTITRRQRYNRLWLWFDVERRYKTIKSQIYNFVP